jgi:hypothetical protein
MREALEKQAEYLMRTLFDAPATYDVAVIIPKPEHSRQFFEAENVGGMYSHGQRRLIARDIGFTLRHEFVHVLHFRHMEHLQQPHRLWVQEGIAALFEDYELGRDGSIRFIANERHNVIRNRVRTGGAMPWATLFELPGERFMARATALYPQARSIFEFLADQGKLDEWYRAYVAQFDDDPDGITALETTFDAPLRDIERQWRRWVQQQPQVHSRTRRGDPSIGVQTDPMASNDGVVVTGLLRGSSAQRAAAVRCGVGGPGAADPDGAVRLGPRCLDPRATSGPRSASGRDGHRRRADRGANRRGRREPGGRRVRHARQPDALRCDARLGTRDPRAPPERC